MAVTILKPNEYLPVAQEILKREIILPRLVTRKGIDEFKGKLNDTINVRIEASTTARTMALRAAPGSRTIQMDSLVQTSYPVALSTKVYNAVPITDEELTLDITDFGAEVLAPQMRAVAVGLENQIVSLFQGATYKNTLALDLTDAQKTMNRLRRVMNDAYVPFDNRVCAVGSAFAEALLNDNWFRNAANTGETIAATALSRATLRDAAGFRFVEVPALDPYQAFAFHPSAWIMASGAPQVPAGAVDGATMVNEGIALRAMRDYLADEATDRSIVESWVGTKAVSEVGGADNGKMVRAVKLTVAPYGS